METLTLQDKYINSVLAELAYINFEKDKNTNQINADKIINKVSSIEEFSIEDAKKIFGILEQKDDNTKNIIKLNDEIHYKFNKSKGYEIVATTNDYDIGKFSSFDGILFKNRENGQLTIAVRGTDFFNDPLKDLVIADGSLTISGTALFQDMSMQNFYNILKDDGLIPQNHKINLTGHSLAGGLIQKFVLHNQDIVNQAYTYNAPGLGGAKAEILNSLGVLPDNIPNDKIRNIILGDGYELISGMGVMIGDVEYINGFDGLNPKEQHSIHTIRNIYQKQINFVLQYNISSSDILQYDKKYVGVYGKIYEIILSHEKKILLVPNKDKSYNKYELTPKIYTIDGNVKEYSVKSYDKEGNLVYPYEDEKRDKRT
ncbi:hypothetical protein OZZ08_13020 [Malaciobacter mytili]|uniref:hypothetical protein n=1 Tax=Malaciobacter mytili TaxID=603050 RepID=UPI003BAEEE27